MITFHPVYIVGMFANDVHMMHDVHICTYMHMHVLMLAIYYKKINVVKVYKKCDCSCCWQFYLISTFMRNNKMSKIYRACFMNKTLFIYRVLHQ